MGTVLGGAFNFIDQNLFRGKLPFTLKDHSIDSRSLKAACDSKAIEYPRADGVLTFDKNASVFLTNTNHEEDQPVHLLVQDTDVCRTRCRTEYGNPCIRFCPANLYEMVDDEDSGKRLQINASNSVHCKPCDIMDPYQIIDWVPPEGGGGPEYDGM